MKTRRHLFLLALALLCLWGVIHLQGCGSVKLAPNGYDWFPSGYGRMVYYRWHVVNAADFQSTYCGFRSPEGYAAGAACVSRHPQGVVQPGDRSIVTGHKVRSRFEGPLCVVYSTLTEDAARRLLDKYSERDLWSHEVIAHCYDGLNHAEVRQ